MKPEWCMTLEEWARRNPRLVCSTHYHIVLMAFKRGEEIPKEVLDCYPSIKDKRKCKKSRDGTVDGGDSTAK